MTNQISKLPPKDQKHVIAPASPGKKKLNVGLKVIKKPVAPGAFDC